MSQEMLDQLRSLDPAMLIAVLRQQQANPALELLDWSVEPLGHEKIIGTTGGLYHFRGHGLDGKGIRPWSVVLKIVNHPPGEMCQAPGSGATGNGNCWPSALACWPGCLALYVPPAATALPSGRAAAGFGWSTLRSPPDGAGPWRILDGRLTSWGVPPLPI